MYLARPLYLFTYVGTRSGKFLGIRNVMLRRTFFSFSRCPRYIVISFLFENLFVGNGNFPVAGAFGACSSTIGY